MHSRRVQAGRALSVQGVLPVLAWTIAAALFAEATAFADARFEVDALSPGRTLPNVQKMLVKWQLKGDDFAAVRRNAEFDVLEFAEYAEIMGATGGNPERDMFKAPENREVHDDYDFQRLVSGCRALLKLGLKPYLKLGNVPQKLSSDIDFGRFTMNIRPPVDYDAYGRYMAACAKTLLDAFGRDELLKWRFAVLTEFENAGWFRDASGGAEETFAAYCRLYEVTVDAFSRTVSPELAFGAHAMACAEGLWDERRFIRHAAEHRLPLKFVTASFYDMQPDKFNRKATLPRTIAHLRNAAESAGLTNLVYGVDEGRVLFGLAKGASGNALPMRIVGDTYQAAYDARIVKQLFDSNADYFAAWGYLSGPDTWLEGLPSVSFHVARETAKFKGMQRLPVKSAGGGVRAGIEADAVAALSPDGETLRIMAYAFTNRLFSAGSTTAKIAVKVPARWRGREVAVTRRRIDDDANWFDEWRKERNRRGIGDERFSWSPDDPAPCHAHGLLSSADKDLFRGKIEPKLRDCARVKPMSWKERLDADGTLSLICELADNSVVFFDVGISPASE